MVVSCIILFNGWNSAVWNSATKVLLNKIPEITVPNRQLYLGHSNPLFFGEILSKFSASQNLSRQIRAAPIRNVADYLHSYLNRRSRNDSDSRRQFIMWLKKIGAETLMFGLAHAMLTVCRPRDQMVFAGDHFCAGAPLGSI